MPSQILAVYALDSVHLQCHVVCMFPRNSEVFTVFNVECLENGRRRDALASIGGKALPFIHL